MSKALFKIWTALAAADGTPAAAPESQAASGNGKSPLAIDCKPGSQGDAAGSGSGAGAGSPKTPGSAPLGLGPPTGSSLRDKVRQKLSTLVEERYFEEEELEWKTVHIACQLEQALSDLYAEPNQLNEYKAKFRSLAFNLGDKKNPELRDRVMWGDLKCYDLVRMDAKQMASQEKQQERVAAKKYEMDKINQSYDEERADTDNFSDLFKCGRCGQRKVRYRQMQTRSADEPMTTFIQCIVCKNKWKQY